MASEKFIWNPLNLPDDSKQLFKWWFITSFLIPVGIIFLAQLYSLMFSPLFDGMPQVLNREIYGERADQYFIYQMGNAAIAALFIASLESLIIYRYVRVISFKQWFWVILFAVFAAETLFIRDDFIDEWRIFYFVKIADRDLSDLSPFIFIGAVFFGDFIKTFGSWVLLQSQFRKSHLWIVAWLLIILMTTVSPKSLAYNLDILVDYSDNPELYARINYWLNWSGVVWAAFWYAVVSSLVLANLIRWPKNEERPL